MSKALKVKIYELINSIEDENVLEMVMEDVAYYADKKDILDEPDAAQLNELNKAIAEVENGEAIKWEDFKKEINGWKNS